jgi:hypothetical protein
MSSSTKLRSPTATVDLTATTGNDLRWPLALDVIDTAGATQDLDVTSCTWALRIAATKGGTAALSGTVTTSWTTTGIKVDTAASGYVTLVITKADVATLTADSTYYYSIQAVTPATQTYIPSMTLNLFEGSLFVEQAA